MVVGPPGTWDACNEPQYQEEANKAIRVFNRYGLIADVAKGFLNMLSRDQDRSGWGFKESDVAVKHVDMCL